MKNLLKIKVNAGALQFTIFISVVIALLVFGFIGLTYVQQKLRLKSSVFKEVVHRNGLTFQTLGNNDKDLTTNNNGIETSVYKRQWGLFEVVSVTTKKGKEEITKTALIGGGLAKKQALYLQDENQPLVLVGNTKIEGNALLPEQGVKQGSIAGHSYMNNQLIYGTIKRSNSQLPKSISFERLKQFKDSIATSNDFELLDLNSKGHIVNPFTNEAKLFYIEGAINLKEINLIGNIIIKSDTRVIVHKSAKLKDLIIIAPIIEIKEAVTGNFQAFADKKIVVGKNTQLDYPTSLLILEKNSFSYQQNNQVQDMNQLIIDRNSIIKGIVGFLTESNEKNYKAQLIIEENTAITGEVYCEQNIELKGIVNGSVYTKGFIANQFGSVYKNHIYNGQILSPELPEQYVGLNFKGSKQKIAKWLYY